MISSQKNQTHPFVIDVTGYTPYAIARLERARITKDVQARRTHFFIKEYWRRRNERERCEAYVKEHKKGLFRGQWETATDQKVIYNRVKYEVSKVLQERKENLEERRNKLVELFRNDEEQYIQELQDTKETPEERKAKMWSRYKELREKREDERRKFSEEMLEQHWRQNCDSLRPLMSKKIRDTIYTEGMEQMKIKDSLAKEKENEDKIYAEMWQKDAEAKTRKELKEAHDRKQRDMENLEDLKKQWAANEERKQKQQLLKEEEAKLMLEHKKLMELDKEWELAQKKQSQERVKKDLDKCLMRKLKQRANEVKEDLLLDMYFLKQIEGFDQREEIEAAERKAELWNEQQRYLNHLAEQIIIEGERHKELDEMYQKESEKMWEKRENEWKAEKEARDELKKKTIKECYEQIRNRLEANRQEQQLIAEYGERVKKQAEADLVELTKEKQEIRDRNRIHQKELLEQISQQKQLEDEKNHEKFREWDAYKEAEEIYQERVKKAMADPDINKLHPFRRKTDISKEKI